VSKVTNELGIVAIVDDDASVRRGLARVLYACGLTVETYASAEEFLESACPQSIACLLLDVQMEGMSGLELIDRLAEAGNLPPTIVITAHLTIGASERSQKHGTTVLRKPIESDVLVAEVGRAMGHDFRWNG
jgi:FixJ family two-component response regulator